MSNWNASCFAETHCFGFKFPMVNLVIIVMTYANALAFEFGPYPDSETCESMVEKHIKELEKSYSILKAHGDCRVLYPELSNLDN